jgi:AAA domain/Primase C terminal 1 (PriCT-1)
MNAHFAPPPSNEAEDPATLEIFRVCESGVSANEALEILRNCSISSLLLEPSEIEATVRARFAHLAQNAAAKATDISKGTHANTPQGSATVVPGSVPKAPVADGTASAAVHAANENSELAPITRRQEDVSPAQALNSIPLIHDGAAAINFLKWLDRDGWHNLWTLHPETGVHKGRTFVPNSWAEIEAFIKRHEGWNLYYTVNEPKPGSPHKKLSRSDIANVRASWADFDPNADIEKAGRGAAERRRIREKTERLLADAAVPASAVVFSGGGDQALWRWRDKLPAADYGDRCAALNKGIQERFIGDNVPDFAHVLRLPGSINFPDEAKRQRRRVPTHAKVVAKNDRRYAPEELERWTAPAVARPPSPHAGKRIVEEDDWARDEGWKYVQNHEGVGQGQRNNTLVVVANNLFDLGCKLETVIDYSTEWSNFLCNPPMDADEIETTVRSALKSRTHAVGCRHPRAPGFEAVEIDESKAPKKVPAPFIPFVGPSGLSIGRGPTPFQDLFTREVKPVAEIIPGLVQKGVVTFLCGPGGVHKSRLSVQWGLCVDAGVPIFEREIEQTRFVYLSSEDPSDEVTRRVQAIKRRLSLPETSGAAYWDFTGGAGVPRKDSCLFDVRENGIGMKPLWDEVRNCLITIKGHKFVVLDSTYNFVTFIDKAKVNETCVKAAIDLLQRLCDETDSTLLCLWHPSQAGQDRGDSGGWSVAWHNAPRSRLSLAETGKDTFELKVEKRSHGARGKPLRLCWDAGTLLPPSQSESIEQKNAARHSVAEVAIKAAETGVPITVQRKIARVHLDCIEEKIGRPMAESEFKDLLQRAVNIEELSYVQGSSSHVAGYYPKGREDLARRAKYNSQVRKPGRKLGENRGENSPKTQ